MSKNQKVVKVVAVDTNEILFEGSMHQLEEAYEYASKMDQLGITVNVVAPTITETLANELGLTNEEIARYNESVTTEIEDHEGSCCHTPGTDKNLH